MLIKLKMTLKMGKRGKRPFDLLTKDRMQESGAACESGV